MSNVCAYSYADALGNTQYVEDTNYNYTGTWSSSGTYVTASMDVVNYSTALYICIRDNVGDNPRRTPTRLRPTNWSILSLLYEYQCDGTVSTSVAEQAYALAESGTNIAWSAYALAQIGTNTGSAAYNLATDASTLAYAALQAAWSGTALGTNYLPKTGGDLSGEVSAPQFVVQVEPVYTSSGTLVSINMAGKGFQTVAFSENGTLTTVNQSAGRRVDVRLISDGTDRNVWIDPQLCALAPYAFAVPTSKTGLATFSAFGTELSDVLVTYTIQP